jgi:hypothetical protein
VQEVKNVSIADHPSFGQAGPGGVAQWTSTPPQEQEDPGLNPSRVKGFLGNHSSAVVYKMT